MNTSILRPIAPLGATEYSLSHVTRLAVHLGVLCLCFALCVMDVKVRDRMHTSDKENGLYADHSKKFLDPNPEAVDFLTLISASLRTDTFCTVKIFVKIRSVVFT